MSDGKIYGVLLSGEVAEVHRLPFYTSVYCFIESQGGTPGDVFGNGKSILYSFTIPRKDEWNTSPDCLKPHVREGDSLKPIDGYVLVAHGEDGEVTGCVSARTRPDDIPAYLEDFKNNQKQKEVGDDSR